ncbi:Os06g0361200 [Oryza sativa Japonica Group]|uniref:Os06g0361200 protein n=1 Tax=Oryza sativa subsp. japonica TaxID=39947 RepID=A0A0P0WWI6_ORYSJ|nr:Os06g0361200 [Oryza sativa Japonica Group]
MEWGQQGEEEFAGGSGVRAGQGERLLRCIAASSLLQSNCHRAGFSLCYAGRIRGVPRSPTEFQVANSGSSLQTTASPAPADYEQEVSSAPQGGFIPVLSKAAKRRRRAAAKARQAASQEHVIKVREATSNDSMPPRFTRAAPAMTRAAPFKTRSYEAYPRFRRTTLGEWPVREIRTGPSKAAPRRRVSPEPKGIAYSTPKKSALGANASPACVAGSSSTPVAVPLNIAPEMLGVVSPKNSLSILGAAPSMSTAAAPSSASTGGALNRPHRLHPLDKGKVVMEDETHHELPSSKKKGVVVLQSVPTQQQSSSPSSSKLRADAPEFIPSSIKKSRASRCKAKKKRTLQWEGVYVSLGDVRMGHVDPTVVPSDTVSTGTPTQCPSMQGSFSPSKNRCRRCNAHRTWVDFLVATEARERRRQR